MKIDYENCRVYFTKEEVSIFNLEKPLSLYCKFINTSERPNVIIGQLGKSSIFSNMVENVSINIEGDNVVIDSIYYIESFQFTLTLLGNAINEISLVKNIGDKVPKLNLPVRTKVVETTVDKEHRHIVTPFRAYSYRRKNYSTNIGSVGEFNIGYSIYPISQLKKLKYPIRLSNDINFIGSKELKRDALFIGYYTTGSSTLDRVGNIKLLSIHKWREFQYGERNLKLLADPTINPTKVFSKMFDSYADICESLNKIKDLEITSITEVKGDKIVDYYFEDNYLEKIGSLGSSCMRYKDCKSKTKFYAEHNNCSLAIMLVTDKIAGRAIIWDCVDGSRVMDRIYTCYERHEKLFIDYCKNNNIQFIYDFKNRIKSSSTGYGPNNFDGSFTKKFKVQLDPKVLAKTGINHCDSWRSTNGKGFPYFDNFFYIDIYNKYLANYESYKDEPNLKYSKSSDYYEPIETLKQWEGHWYNKNSFVTTHKGVEIPEHRAYRINNVWYDHSELCTPWNRNDRELKDKCVYSYRGSYVRMVDIDIYNKYITERGDNPIDNTGREVLKTQTIGVDYKPVSSDIFNTSYIVDDETSRPF